MSYRTLRTWATSISTLLCCSVAIAQWQGRPWHSATNSAGDRIRTWHELQAEYEPYRQLIEAIRERQSVAQFFTGAVQPANLVQTWTVDAGTTNILQDTIVATGFSASVVNGIYYAAGGGAWTNTSGVRLHDDDFFSDGWVIDTATDDFFIFPLYESAVGPVSDQWVTYYTLDPVPGATAEQTQTETMLLTDTVTTTNAFGPFQYNVGQGEQTAHPHLTRQAMAYIDTGIASLLSAYVDSGTVVWTNWSNAAITGFSGTSGLLKAARERTGIDWGIAHTNITESSTNVVYTYTRQPEVEMQWVLAEWVHDGDDWVRTVDKPFDDLVPVWHVPPTLRRVASTNTAPVTVILHGQAGVWGDREGLSVSETVDQGEDKTLADMWHSITNATLSAGARHDVIRVLYDGPVVLGGERPFRLYASDLDERAVVLDQMYITEVKTHHYNPHVQRIMTTAGLYDGWLDIHGSHADASVAWTVTNAPSILDGLQQRSYNELLPVDIDTGTTFPGPRLRWLFVNKLTQQYVLNQTTNEYEWRDHYTKRLIGEQTRARAGFRVVNTNMVSVLADLDAPDLVLVSHIQGWSGSRKISYPWYDAIESSVYAPYTTSYGHGAKLVVTNSPPVDFSQGTNYTAFVALEDHLPQPLPSFIAVADNAVPVGLFVNDLEARRDWGWQVHSPQGSMRLFLFWRFKYHDD